MNKPFFCRNCFLTDWRYKRLKNTIDLLLFYGEPFHGFSESDETKKKGKETKQNSEFIHWPKEKDESKEKSFEINALSNYLFFNG